MFQWKYEVDLFFNELILISLTQLLDRIRRAFYFLVESRIFVRPRIGAIPTRHRVYGVTCVQSKILEILATSVAPPSIDLCAMAGNGSLTPSLLNALAIYAS